MFSLTVYLTALLYIGSQFAVLKLKKRVSLTSGFLCAPEYVELSLFSGTEIFSLFNKVILKKSVLRHKNKRGSREDGKKLIEKQKTLKLVIMKNKSLLQIATRCIFSFPSIVCNKCIYWSQNIKLKNVKLKIGRFDYSFHAGNFFSL